MPQRRDHAQRGTAFGGANLDFVVRCGGLRMTAKPWSRSPLVGEHLSTPDDALTVARPCSGASARGR